MSKKKEAGIEEGNEAGAPTTQEEVTGTVPEVIVCDSTDPEDGSIKVVTTQPVKEGKTVVKNLKAILYYNFGSNLPDMVSKFGEDVVYSQARAQMKVRLQAAKRIYMKAGKDVASLVTKFIPGVAMERLPQDMSKASEAYFDGLSEEEQDAMIARLQAKRS